MAKESKEDITQIVLNAVGLAMGVAVIVMSTMGVALGSVNILLGIGLACLGIASLDRIS